MSALFLMMAVVSTQDIWKIELRISELRLRMPSICLVDWMEGMVLRVDIE